MERFDVRAGTCFLRVMAICRTIWFAAVAWICAGCDQAPQLKDADKAGLPSQALQELPPVEEEQDEKAKPSAISPQEEKAKLAALLGRLEQASEEVAQAEDELPLVFGAVTDAKGNRYVGQFKDGKRHGYGTYQFATGDRYEGEYRDGRREGYGNYQFKKGDRYVGYFQKGKYHRWGAYFFPNGDKFFGEYNNGLRNGKGTHVQVSGERYEGEFLDGKRHGLGRCDFGNGDLYAGSWKNGEPDGWGTFHYAGKAFVPKNTSFDSPTKNPVGSTPPPEIRDNLRAGDHFLLDALQLRESGGTETTAKPIARNPLPPLALLPPNMPSKGDEPLTPSLQELPGGDRYVGQLRDGQPHGQGAYLFSGGERYVGDFIHGLHHGQGLLVLGDGRRYLGEWQNGLRHGYGVLYDQKGLVEREGDWQQDVPVEP